MELHRNIVLVINDLKGNGAERVVITLNGKFTRPIAIEKYLGLIQ